MSWGKKNQGVQCLAGVNNSDVMQLLGAAKVNILLSRASGGPVLVYPARG